MTPTILFTRHACQRYREFHLLDRPTATDDDARALLEQHAGEATRVGQTSQGDPVWAIWALGVELVVKHEDDQLVCVTVLPPVRFRGLTPLQAEAVHAEAERRAAEVATLAAEQAALATSAPTSGVAHASLKQQIQLAALEREILGAAFKTMRHQLSEESIRAATEAKATHRRALHEASLLAEERKAAHRWALQEAGASADKAALRLAVRHLESSREPGARDVLGQIRALRRAAHHPSAPIPATIGGPMTQPIQPATPDETDADARRDADLDAQYRDAQYRADLVVERGLAIKNRHGGGGKIPLPDGCYRLVRLEPTMITEEKGRADEDAFLLVSLPCSVNGCDLHVRIERDTRERGLHLRLQDANDPRRVDEAALLGWNELAALHVALGTELATRARMQVAARRAMDGVEP